MTLAAPKAATSKAANKARPINTLAVFERERASKSCFMAFFERVSQRPPIRAGCMTMKPTIDRQRPPIHKYWGPLAGKAVADA